MIRRLSCAWDFASSQAISTEGPGLCASVLWALAVSRTTRVFATRQGLFPAGEDSFFAKVSRLFVRGPSESGRILVVEAFGFLNMATSREVETWSGSSTDE